jgi:hypothetical protein
LEKVGGIINTSADMEVYGEEKKGGAVCMKGSKKSAVIYVSCDMGNGGEGKVCVGDIVYS